MLIYITIRGNFVRLGHYGRQNSVVAGCLRSKVGIFVAGSVFYDVEGLQM